MMNRPLFATLLLLLPLAACDCGEDLSELNPEAYVTPESLDMGERPVNIASDATFTLGNRGNATFTVFGTEVLPLEAQAEAAFNTEFLDTSGTGFSITLPDRVFPASEVEGIVTISAPAQGRFGATLLIKTDDADNPELKVHVMAIGGPPRIAATPNPVDFGQVNQGLGAEIAVQIENIGFDVLTMTEIRVESDDGSFTLAQGAPVEGTASVGDALAVNVRLDPLGTDTGTREGELVVISNAEGAEEFRVPLSGEVNLAPQARAVEFFSRQTVYKASLQSEVIIDGSETIDPEGSTVIFDWSIESKPENSIAFLLGAASGDACESDGDCDTEDRFRCVPQGNSSICRQVAQTRILPDLVGEYVILLRATDAQGAFSEARVRLLPRDLAVVLKWETAANATCQSMSEEACEALSPAERRQQCCGQSDLDLHLVRPGSVLGDYGSCPAECEQEQCFEPGDEFADTCRQSGGDCAFANRHPDWAAIGRADDPRLDIDDVRGFGPEVITLNNPEDGVYTAYVHYCTDRISEPTLATLEVYVEGILEASTPAQLIESQGLAWTAMSLIRSEGTWDLVAVPDIFAPDVDPTLCQQ